MQPSRAPDPAAITFDQVRDLLRHLARGSTPLGSDLADCAFVRRSLEAAGFVSSPESRAYELGRLMVETVSVELGRLRARAGLSAPGGDIEAALRADFAQCHPLLEAWSAVYHLCLRPDLGLDLQSVTDRLQGLHRRTLQRRLRRGVEALTQGLRTIEREALVQDRREQLWRSLPESMSRPLYGVEGPIELAVSTLLDKRGSGAVALAGPGGVGKTAIARAVAERCLIEGDLGEARWIDGTRPDLALGSHLQSPRQARSRRSLVIVDGVDRPLVAESLAALRASLPPTVRILATGRVGCSAWSGLRVIEAPLLLQRDAMDILRHEARLRGMRDIAAASSAELMPLVSATAGHPLALQQAVAALRATTLDRVAEDFTIGRGPALALAKELWAPAWAQAGTAIRNVVAAVIAARRHGCVTSEIAIARRAGLGREPTCEALAQAVDLGLLSRTAKPKGGSFHTGLWLGRFVEQELSVAELAQSAD